MLQTKPFEVNIFSGGITDNYLDGNPAKYKVADNFLVTINQKLYTRPGSHFLDEDNPVIPSAERLAALILFREQLFFQSNRNFFYIDTTFQTLQGPSGNAVFNQGSVASFTSWSEWNNHLIVVNSDFASPMKIYEDNTGVFRVRNAGLPALVSSPIVTPVAGANRYVYAFIYSYQYQALDNTFIDFGPVTYVEISSAAAPNVSPIAITAISALTNGATNNFDTAVIKVEIYRTVNQGSVLYFVNSVTNGVTLYNDNMSDATLVNNETIYINDGSQDHEPAPNSKYVHIINGVGYYAHIKVGSNVFRNRIIQSFKDNPDSVNSRFFVDLNYEIKGISSYRYTPIVFCERAMYRLDGIFNEDGSDGIVATEIDDTVGCISHNSIVRTREGLFFAALDGFYWTDGYKTLKISNEFDLRYSIIASNSPESIYGTFDDTNTRVYWAAKSDGSSADNDVLFILDLRFGIKPDACFTTWSGGNNFDPSCLVFFDSGLVRGSNLGYVFKHEDNLYTDLKMDLTRAPDDWVRAIIEYNYISCAYNFGTQMYRKWVTYVTAVMANATNLSLLIRSINDDSGRIADLKPIRFLNNILWGTPELIWGDEQLLWNYVGFIEEKRRFPANNLRCSYKQVQFTNAIVTLLETDRDGAGQVIVDNALKTATLVDFPNFIFPDDSEDYFLSFDFDNFEQEFLITLRNSDSVATFEDIENDVLAGTFDFKLRGKPKDEVLNLLHYTLHYDAIGKTQKPFRKTDMV